MNEKFREIKRRRLFGAAIESCICGIAAGLIIVGVVLLSLKLSGIKIGAGLYVLMGVLPALIVGGLVFLMLKPTDYKLAESLDNEFNLHEKVRTSLAYQGQEGAILQMQREDAAERLDNLPRRKLKPVTIIKYAVIVAVALAISITSFVIPAKAEQEQPPVDQDVMQVTDVQLSIIKELIDYVASNDRLEESKRTQCAEKLNSFYEKLPTLTKKSELKPELETLVGDVTSLLGSLFVGDVYDRALSEVQAICYANVTMGRALAAALDSYINVTITDTRTMSTFITDLDDVVVRPNIEDGFERIKAWLYPTEPPEEPIDPVESMTELCATATLNLVGINPDNVLGEDELFVAIDDLVKSLAALDISAENVNLEAQIYQVLDEKTNSLTKACSEHAFLSAYTMFICNTIISRLPQVGVETLKAPSVAAELITESGSGGGDDEGGGGSGGGGQGGLKVGTSDKVWDFDSESYTKVSPDMIKRYQQIVDELRAQGLLTEDQSKAIDNFFDYLLKGIDQDNNNEE